MCVSSDVGVSALASLILSDFVAHTVGARLSRSNLIELLVSFPSRLHHVQHAAGKEYANANAGTGVRPAHVVVLPMGHPIATVTTSSKYDDGDQSEYGCNKIKKKVEQKCTRLAGRVVANAPIRIVFEINNYMQPLERHRCWAKPPCSDRHHAKIRKHRASAVQTPAAMWMSAWRKIVRQCRNRAADNRGWCSTPLRIPTCNQWNGSRRSDGCRWNCSGTPSKDLQIENRPNVNWSANVHQKTGKIDGVADNSLSTCPRIAPKQIRLELQHRLESFFLSSILHTKRILSKTLWLALLSTHKNKLTSNMRDDVMSDWTDPTFIAFASKLNRLRATNSTGWKTFIEMHSPRLRNFGCLSLPSNTSQYGETNARKIKINAIAVKLTAILKFLLWTPILMHTNDDSH